MEKTSKRHPVLSTLVALSVAGTCLAAPGLAFAAESGALSGLASSAADAVSETTASEEEAVEGSQLLVAGGIQVAVPITYETVDLGDIITAAANEDGSIVVTLTDLGLDADDVAEFPTDQDEAAAVFEEIARQAADEVDGTVETSSISEGEGFTAYGFLVSCTSDDGDMYCAQYYVLTDEGLVLLQIACSVDAADLYGDELSGIERSIALSDAEEGSAAAIEGTVYEVAGLAITVPDDFEYDEESTDEDATWYSADGSVLIGVLGDLGEGESVDSSYFDDIAQAFIESVDGEYAESAVLENGDLELSLYGFTIVDGDDEYLGIIALTNVTDDYLSLVFVLADFDIDDDMSNTVGAILDSIELA